MYGACLQDAPPPQLLPPAPVVAVTLPPTPAPAPSPAAPAVAAPAPSESAAGAEGLGVVGRPGRRCGKLVMSGLSFTRRNGAACT